MWKKNVNNVMKMITFILIQAFVGLNLQAVYAKELVENKYSCPQIMLAAKISINVNILQQAFAQKMQVVAQTPIINLQESRINPKEKLTLLNQLSEKLTSLIEKLRTDIVNIRSYSGRVLPELKLGLVCGLLLILLGCRTLLMKILVRPDNLSPAEIGLISLPDKQTSSPVTGIESWGWAVKETTPEGYLTLSLTQDCRTGGDTWDQPWASTVLNFENLSKVNTSAYVFVEYKNNSLKRMIFDYWDNQAWVNFSEGDGKIAFEVPGFNFNSLRIHFGENNGALITENKAGQSITITKITIIPKDANKPALVITNFNPVTIDHQRLKILNNPGDSSQNKLLFTNQFITTSASLKNPMDGYPLFLPIQGIANSI